MLVLTRRLGESIAIDDNIKIVVVQIKGKQVRLGIEAPKTSIIHREEIYNTIKNKNRESALGNFDQQKLISKSIRPQIN